MNMSRFREIIEKLLAAEKQYEIQEILQQLRRDLQEMVNQPQQPGPQTAFAATLSRLRRNVGQLRSSFSPAEWKRFDEIGASDQFLADISQDIEKEMAGNPLTPAVTLNSVAQLAKRRSEYLAALNELNTRLDQLGIKSMEILPGEAEIGVLLPRALFQNHLFELSVELRAINRILRVVAEVATGTVEPVEVNELSTSDPIFFLGMSVPTIILFGKLVRWALERWKQVEDIRKIRAETQKVSAFTEVEIKTMFDTKIETVISDAIDKKVEELVPKIESAGRSHEQRTDLAWALESVLSRVERGMTVELRFLPPPEPKDDAEADYTKTLQELAPQLSFPIPDSSPVLRLPPAEPPSAAAN